MMEQDTGERTASDSPRDLFGNPTMTIDEAARLYGVPPLILRKAIERGEFVATPATEGQELLSRAAVLEWLKRRSAGWA
jgi:excisionase family DNA binding protein